jgi:hypothetical protein
MKSTDFSNRVKQGRALARINAMRHRLSSKDPTLAGILDNELDRAIARAADALRQSPRSGLRKWLRALTREKNRRRSRREWAARTRTEAATHITGSAASPLHIADRATQSHCATVCCGSALHGTGHKKTRRG